ncbi:MAG TPA: RpiB/LacA/LacB family sugar-phosphate isomerase [Acidimicrobiales bacterium]
MRIAFGTDERTALTTGLVDQLRREGHDVEELADGSEWPEVGRAVGAAVARGRADRGIVCCTTGTGVSIAANKVPGVRAALCVDAQIARGARRWNDANVLALSLALAEPAVAAEVVGAFLQTPFDDREAGPVARLEQGT